MNELIVVDKSTVDPIGHARTHGGVPRFDGRLDQHRLGSETVEHINPAPTFRREVALKRAVDNGMGSSPRGGEVVVPSVRPTVDRSEKNAEGQRQEVFEATSI